MPHGKHVKVVIGVDGSCQVDAVQFTDASCLSVTKEITAALGGGIMREESKPEARICRCCGQPDKARIR
jgi:hypothetical protein